MTSTRSTLVSGIMVQSMKYPPAAPGALRGRPSFRTLIRREPIPRILIESSSMAVPISWTRWTSTPGWRSRAVSSEVPIVIGKSSVLTTVMLGTSASRAFSTTSMVIMSSWKYFVSSLGPTFSSVFAFSLGFSFFSLAFSCPVVWARATEAVRARASRAANQRRDITSPPRL